MFMHTCACNTITGCIHILKLTSQISLAFDSLISVNFSFKFFRFADMLTKTN